MPPVNYFLYFQNMVKDIYLQSAWVWV